MTALKGYERLEAPALWREDPHAQRRDVIVSFGNATLVISDTAERPLTHWSLAAIERLNPDETPALYGPGADATDTLEIEDPTMVEAIETVRRAVERNRPHPGRLRLALTLTALAAVLAAGVLWLPDALVRNAAAMAPEATRAEIGDRLLSDLRRVAGAPCRTTLGTRALGVLHDRLRGADAPGRFVVVREGVRRTVELPGGIVVIHRALVERSDDPAALAGFVLAEGLRSEALDPMERLLRDAGPWTAFRLLTTGDIPEATLSAHAETLLAAPDQPVPEEALLRRFAAAGVPSSPYAYALDPSGETSLGLIEADPGVPADAPPLMSDGEWISLQGICDT